MIMAQNTTPKPMPTTGMPDRNEPLPRNDYDQMKTGVKTTGTATFNPGRPTGK